MYRDQPRRFVLALLFWNDDIFWQEMLLSHVLVCFLQVLPLPEVQDGFKPRLSEAKGPPLHEA